MFKLVGIGGRIRGQEFDLSSGDNIFGRAVDGNNQVDFEGISKSHFVIKSDNENLILEDLKSSNGTFVNNELVTVKNLEMGDVVAIPNAIFRVVRINKKVVKLYDKNLAEDLSEDASDAAPQDLIGKVKYKFAKKLMAPVYSLNKSYEWSSLIFMVFFIFIIVNILLIMESTLQASNKAILNEALLRGEQYIDEVIRRNAANMANKEYQQMDVSFLERVNGVVDYSVFDTKGRILRPIERENIGINDPFSVRAKEFLDQRGTSQERYRRKITDSRIGIAKVIKIYNPERQREEVVGYVSLVFEPSSLREMVTQNRVAYLEALIISTIIGMFFCGIIYYLTRNIFIDLIEKIDAAQSNKIKEVKSDFLMEEVKPLRSITNDLIFKIRELSDDDSHDFDEVEDDSRYLNSLSEILKGYPGAGVVLNAEKTIISLNQEGEDVLGIRENMSEGSAVEEVLRDQGLAATIISLCDQSAEEDGRHCSEPYEISGAEYQINVVTSIGKDSFAKGYLISFVRDY